ncbi:MAG: DUF2917 domain-containing protein [Bdellovibrionota bacterium]
MNTIKSSHISIDPGQVTSIQTGNERKLSLVVREGVAWVTAEGDRSDYFLRKGEVMELDCRRSLILIESVSGHLELDVISA